MIRFTIKKPLLLLFVLIIALFFISCTKVVCKPPYIQVGEHCCLDENNDKICDEDKPFDTKDQCPIFECPECPLECDCQVNTKTKEVFKYVCEDGFVANSKDECFALRDVEFDPITTNENGTPIQFVTVRPFCTNNYHNGGHIRFSINRVAQNISFQVKEHPEQDWLTLDVIQGTIEGNTFFGICDSCKDRDFQLLPGRVYLFRMMFDITKPSSYPIKYPEELIYSNEHIIDTREKSDYMREDCSPILGKI